MNLKEELLENHSKQQMLRIKKFIGNDSKRFSELMKIILINDDVLPQRASWALIHIVENNKHLVEPWIGKIIKLLSEPIHSSTKRNLIRIFEDIEIPEKYRGELYSLCFKFLTSTSEPIAVKAFSMTVLNKIANHYPELKKELLIVVNDFLETNPSPAIQSRGKKIRKSLLK